MIRRFVDEINLKTDIAAHLKRSNINGTNWNTFRNAICIKNAMNYSKNEFQNASVRNATGSARKQCGLRSQAQTRTVQFA